MKLYLSSYRVPAPNELLSLLPKPANQCRLVIIPNAKDYKLPDERAVSLDELTADLEKLGLAVDVTDLRDYEDTALLRDRLREYDVMWVAGGNTFVLREEMQRSGLDQFIRELLEAGMVYCGESAGAIVAGISLKGSEIADDADVANEAIWDGLELIDKIVVPHADNPEFIEYVNHMKKRYAGDNRVVYINDAQALIINN